MRNGDFTTCGAACNRALRDPLTGQPFPGNQIPVSRFDPAALNVLKYLPQAGAATADVQVPRLIAQDDNQVDREGRSTSSAQTNQVGVRYFFDHFTNDPTFNEATC